MKNQRHRRLRGCPASELRSWKSAKICRLDGPSRCGRLSAGCYNRHGIPRASSNTASSCSTELQPPSRFVTRVEKKNTLLYELSLEPRTPKENCAFIRKKCSEIKYVLSAIQRTAWQIPRPPAMRRHSHSTDAQGELSYAVMDFEITTRLEMPD
jgi:hypothetical protein